MMRPILLYPGDVGYSPHVYALGFCGTGVDHDRWIAWWMPRVEAIQDADETDWADAWTMTRHGRAGSGLLHDLSDGGIWTTS